MMEPIIRDNCGLNQLWPKLTIAMLADEEADSSLYVPQTFLTASTDRRWGAQIVKTRTVPFRDLIDAARPTFLIMDIEGGEVEIVRMLEQGPIHKIAKELHPDAIAQEGVIEIHRKLVSLGFIRRWVSNAGDHVYYEWPLN